MKNITKKQTLLFATLLALTSIFILAFYFTFFKKPSSSKINNSLFRPNEGFKEDVLAPINNNGEFQDKPIDVFDESSVETFEILSVHPGVGKVFLAAPNLALSFRFNFPINTNTISFNSDPKIEFTTRYDEENNVLYIKNLEFWEYETIYRITLSVESESGEKLSKPFKTTFIPTRDEKTEGLFENLEDKHISI